MFFIVIDLFEKENIYETIRNNMISMARLDSLAIAAKIKEKNVKSIVSIPQR